MRRLRRGQPGAKWDQRLTKVITATWHPRRAEPGRSCLALTVRPCTTASIEPSVPASCRAGPSGCLCSSPRQSRCGHQHQTNRATAATTSNTATSDGRQHGRGPAARPRHKHTYGSSDIDKDTYCRGIAAMVDSISSSISAISSFSSSLFVSGSCPSPLFPVMI